VLAQFGPAHARDDATLGRFLAAMPAGIPVAVELPASDLIWWAERIREWAARGANTLAYF
jgi:hypothetical protein